MLDKNPELLLDKDFSEIQNRFSKKVPNVVVCSHPFVKEEFLNRIIDGTDGNVIFLDFDLLYSGYVTAKLIKKNSKVTVYHLNTENWNYSFAKIIEDISKEKYLVIIDTLNGVNNLFEDKNSARFVNASIMLLATSGRAAGSYVIATAMARKKDDDWVLSPGGRHVSPRDCKIYYIKQVGNKIGASLIDKKDFSD